MKALTFTLVAEPPERLALAHLCSRIENDWCGQETGLLDQLASLYGEAGFPTRHEEEHAGWIKRWRGEKGY